MKLGRLVIHLITAVAAQNACSDLIQDILVPLRQIPAVQTLCSSRYPIKLLTYTSTSTLTSTQTMHTVTTVSTEVVTTTQSKTITPAVFEVTSFATLISTSTVIITPTPVTDSVPASTVTGNPITITVTVTSTTTDTPKRFAKRAITTSNASRKTTAQGQGQGHGQAAISTLLAQAENVISTFCSCAEQHPSSVTTIKFVTSVLKAPAATSIVIAISTLTVTTTIIAPTPSQTIQQTTTVIKTTSITASANIVTVSSGNTTVRSTSTVTRTSIIHCPLCTTSDCHCYQNINMQIGCYQQPFIDEVNGNNAGADCYFIYLNQGKDDCAKYNSNGNTYQCVFYPGGKGERPSGCAQRC